MPHHRGKILKPLPTNHKPPSGQMLISAWICYNFEKNGFSFKVKSKMNLYAFLKSVYRDEAYFIGLQSINLDPQNTCHTFYENIRAHVLGVDMYWMYCKLMKWASTSYTLLKNAMKFLFDPTFKENSLLSELEGRMSNSLSCEHQRGFWEQNMPLYSKTYDTQTKFAFW